MSNNNKIGGWATIVRSVRTPLGFFTLAALVLDGVLTVTTSVTNVPIVFPVLLFGMLIVVVSAIAVIKPLALYHPSDWPKKSTPVTVNLVFPIKPIDVDLEVGKCVLEVRDVTGRVKPNVVPSLTFDHGGWSLNLTEDVEASDSVRLELVEHSGRKWRVKPFTPYETDREAVQVPQ